MGLLVWNRRIERADIFLINFYLKKKFVVKDYLATKTGYLQTCKKSQPRDIGCGNIHRLRKDKGWNTVEFEKNINFNSMNA